jgi:uncharacterized membrane protein
MARCSPASGCGAVQSNGPVGQRRTTYPHIHRNPQNEISTACRARTRMTAFRPRISRLLTKWAVSRFSGSTRREVP